MLVTFQIKTSHSTKGKTRVLLLQIL